MPVSPAASATASSALDSASIVVAPLAAAATGSCPASLVTHGSVSAVATATASSSLSVASVVVGPATITATASCVAPTIDIGASGVVLTIVAVPARANAIAPEQLGPLPWFDSHDQPPVPEVMPVHTAAAATASAPAVTPGIRIAPPLATATAVALIPGGRGIAAVARATASAVGPTPAFTIPVTPALATASITAPIRTAGQAVAYALATASIVAPVIRLTITPVARASATASITVPVPRVTAPGPLTLTAVPATALGSGLVATTGSRPSDFGIETTLTWADLLRESKDPGAAEDDVQVGSSRWLAGGSVR